VPSSFRTQKPSRARAGRPFLHACRSTHAQPAQHPVSACPDCNDGLMMMRHSSRGFRNPIPAVIVWAQSPSGLYITMPASTGNGCQFPMTGSMFLPCYGAPVTKLIGNAAILVAGLILIVGSLLATGVVLCGASPGRVAAETATRGRMIRFRRFRFSALTGGTFRRLKRARRIRAYGFVRLSSATLSKTRDMRTLSLIRTSTSFLPGNCVDMHETLYHSVVLSDAAGISFQFPDCRCATRARRPVLVRSIGRPAGLVSIPPSWTSLSILHGSACLDGCPGLFYQR